MSWSDILILVSAVAGVAVIGLALRTLEHDNAQFEKLQPKGR